MKYFERKFYSKLIISFFVLSSVLLSGISFYRWEVWAASTRPNISSHKGIVTGVSKKKFFKKHPKSKARTYRSSANEDWLTYDDWSDPLKMNMITVHFKDDSLVSWTLNNKEEVVEEYLGEFCSRAFILYYPKIYSAIRNAMLKIPLEVFRSITDRSRPVLFTEFHSTGTGRFANTSEIIATRDDAPAFEGGLTIIKLNTDLEAVEDGRAIEGVVLHELAHRYLEHGVQKASSCEMEREANALVARWGMSGEYQKASESFGHKESDGPAPCGKEK